MTFVEWLNLNPGWFFLYLLIGICVIPMALENISNVVNRGGSRVYGIFAVTWFIGWIMLAVALIAGGVWILSAFPLWLTALGAFGIAVLLLILTFVGVVVKAYYDKHTYF